MHIHPLVPARSSSFILPSAPMPMTAALRPMSGGAALVAFAMTAASDLAPAGLAMPSWPDLDGSFILFVHGFITFTGEKMSKSRGTGISPQDYIDRGLNPEWLRYYIAAKLNARVEDLDFNPDDFIARVNSDLIGKYVNIASRAASFITKHFAGQCGTPSESEQARAQRLSFARSTADEAAKLYDAREYGRVLRDVMRIADGSTKRSTLRNRGCWPRIPISAMHCKPSVRRLSPGSSCSPCCWRRCCRRWRRGSRTKCSGSTAILCGSTPGPSRWPSSSIGT